MIVDNSLKDIFSWIDNRVTTMSSSNVRSLQKVVEGIAGGGAILLHKNHDPIAVIVSYDTYLKIQESIDQ